MKTLRILILEDDIQTLSRLVRAIELLQKGHENIDVGISILSEYMQVEEYLNTAKKNIFDIILLDRDCKACGSFHCLDFTKYSVDKIIAISSVPEYNKNAEEKGVTRVVHKDFQNLDIFIYDVIGHIEEMIFDVNPED